MGDPQGTARESEGLPRGIRRENQEIPRKPLDPPFGKHLEMPAESSSGKAKEVRNPKVNLRESIGTPREALAIA